MSTQTPNTPCPPYCTDHVDGNHVNEFAGPGHVGDGYHVYARRSMNAQGVDAVETVVVQEDGPEIRVRIPLTPGTPVIVTHKEGPAPASDEEDGQ